MYAVLLALPCKLFLKMMSQTSSLWNIASPNYLFYYLADMVRLLTLSGLLLLQKGLSKAQTVLANSGLFGSENYILAALVLLTILVM
jgi:hypothetical protein